MKVALEKGHGPLPPDTRDVSGKQLRLRFSTNSDEAASLKAKTPQLFTGQRRHTLI
jgi:hypothetical protein